MASLIRTRKRDRLRTKSALIYSSFIGRKASPRVNRRWASGRYRATTPNRYRLSRYCLAAMLTGSVLMATPAQAKETKNPCYQYKPLALKAGWKPKDLPRLMYICERESKGFTRAWNKADPYTGSYGLTQLNGSWYGTFKRAGLVRKSMVELFNPLRNLRAAYWVYTKSGWAPWGTKASK